MQFPPLETPVIVTMGDGTEFRAMRIIVAGDVTDRCETWATAEEHEPKCPACWTDGVCWGSNEDNKPSRQPVAWRTAT